MKTCPDCGSPVYNLGCTWCNESLYIEEQIHFDRMAEWDRAKEQRELSKQHSAESGAPRREAGDRAGPLVSRQPNDSGAKESGDNGSD